MTETCCAPEDGLMMLLIGADPQTLMEVSGQLESEANVMVISVDPDEAQRLLTEIPQEFRMVVCDGIESASVAKLVQQYRVDEHLHPFIVLAEPGEKDQYVNATMQTPGITVLAKPLDTTQLLIAGMHQQDMNSRGRIAELVLDADEHTQHSMRARLQAGKNLQDLRHAQDKLLQSEKVSSLGILAADAAKEIDSPVGSICSNMSTLSHHVGILEDILKQFCETGRPLAGEKDTTATMAFILSDIEKLVSETIKSSERVRKIVSEIRSFISVDDLKNIRVGAGHDVNVSAAPQR